MGPTLALVPTRHPVRYVDRRVGDKPLQRTAAFLALLLGAAGLVLLVWFVANRPLHLLLLVVGVVVMLYLVFAALTSTGSRRALAGVGALIVGVVVIAGSVAKLVGEEGIRWSGPGGLAALAVAVLLARYALRIPPPRSSDRWAVPSAGPTTRRGVLLANPASGGGKVGRSGLVEVARHHGIEVLVLGPDDDLRGLAERAVADGADALGVAGGDGSLAVVAQVCVDHDLPFVCVPAGTRNHYALDLGLDRADPPAALAAFVNGEEHRLDYSVVNGRMFLNNVSLGGYAAAVEQPGYRDAKVEATLAVLPDLVAQGGPWFDLRFEVPEAGHWESAALLQVSNGAYEMAGVGFGRRRRLDEGVLGVVAVDLAHVADLVTITVLAAAQQTARASGVWPWSTETFRVTSAQPLIGAGVDGEHVKLPTPLEFRCVPGGLRVLVPSGTPVGLEAQHLGTRSTIGGLFEVAFDLGSDPSVA